MMKPLVVLLAALLSAPAWAQGHEAAPAEHGGAAQAAPHGEPRGAEPGAHAAAPAHGGGHAGLPADASCQEILASEPAEEEAPAVSDVIFHHVTDHYDVKFESPFSHRAVGVDFKKLGCQLFGWNGVVGHIGNTPVDLTVTKHLFWMWVAAAVLIALFWIGAPKKGQMVPRGLGNMLEAMVVFVRDEFARKNIPDPKEADRYTPFLLNCFFFILVMNFLGLIPYLASATSNLNVTLGLALLTFILTQAAGIRSAGLGGYLKHLTGGVHPLLWPIMIPVEFLGLFTKPFALTIRLFANMVAGHIVIFFLLGLIFIMKTAALAPISVGFAFAIYLLEIFVALVQAYVFTLLSSLFIGFGVAMGHHEHGDGHSANQEAHH
jgi:F-type H+-transporting ATPase subunit a